MSEPNDLPEREAMEYDVVIVGAGPSGLAAAIRIKELDEALTVVVVEKGSVVGAHILSGVVVDPIGLDRLFPDWRQDPERPLKTQVTEDHFIVLGPSGSLTLPNWPMPRFMNNHGKYVGSLGAVTRWMAAKAEALGVEIYPGFAATEVLYDENGAVVGIATGDMGVGRDGKPSRRNSGSASRKCGRSTPAAISPARCSIHSAGRSAMALPAARSFITTTKTSSRSATSST